MNDKRNVISLLLTIDCFEYIYLLHTIDGTYELYSGDIPNTIAVSRTGFFHEIVAHIRDGWVSAAEQQDYYEMPRLETVIMQLQENGGQYCYRFVLPDGEREASFFYYEPSHKEILMTVRRVPMLPEAIIASQHVKEYRDILQAALVHSGLDFWEYHPDNDTVIVTQYNSCYHIFANAATAESGALITDYPEAWIDLGYVHPDDSEKIRIVIKAIKDGQAIASYERRKMHEDGRYHWERVRFISIYDHDGKRLKVICSNENIDSYKKLEIRYAANLAYFQALKYKALLFCHLNVTRNLVNDVQSQHPYLMEQFYEITADSLFAKLLNFTAEGAWKRKLSEILDLSALSHALELGITHHKAEHRFYTALNRVEWVNTSIDLTHNPTTGDIEAFVYSVSINEQKIADAVMNNIIVNEYENITSIDVRHDSYISYVARDQMTFVLSERGSNFS